MFYRKYLKEIWAGIFFVLGIVTIIFGKNKFFQFGFTFLSWAVCVFIMYFITTQNMEQRLIDFDKEAKDVLKDIEINGSSSEYYGVVDINIINKRRNKLYKKLNKERTVLLCIGVILIISSIICMI